MTTKDATPVSSIPLSPPGIPRATVVFMALASALGTATIYLLQPSLADVSTALDHPVSDIGVALAAGPVGYLLGLVLMVPLIDRFAPGRVLAAQLIVLALALAASAVVVNVPLLAACVALTGLCSVVGAGMSSLAGRLSTAERRATTLGVVTSGISGGIIGGRFVGGLLSEHLGWRGMLLAVAAACVVAAVLCLLALPNSPSASAGSVWQRISSIPGLFVRHQALRFAAARGALWFFAFCAVWAGLAAALSEPPYELSSERIGLYALAGLAGVLATQVAGRATDRVGSRAVVLVGLAIAAAAAACMTFSLDSQVATMVCLALFDAGLFAAQVANQSTVLAIDPSAPARFNSGYMVVYFLGGSLGTAVGPSAVSAWGWATTAGIATGAIVAAAAWTVLFDRRAR